MKGDKQKNRIAEEAIVSKERLDGDEAEKKLSPRSTTEIQLQDGTIDNSTGAQGKRGLKVLCSVMCTSSIPRVDSEILLTDGNRAITPAIDDRNEANDIVLYKKNDAMHPAEDNKPGEKNSSGTENDAELMLVNECNFDEGLTELYDAIQNKQFDYALKMFQLDGEGKESDESMKLYNIAVEQAKTWVSRYERDGETLRWRMLCLHAALFFKAPLELIKKLLEVVPSSVIAQDDQGMSPLHLAFKYHKDIDTILHILELYPRAIFVEDKKGRIPLQCYSFSEADQNSKLLWHYSEFAIKAERERVIFDVKQKYQNKLYDLEQKHKEHIETMERKNNDITTELQNCRTSCYSLISKNQACLENEENLNDRVKGLKERSENNEIKIKKMYQKMSELEDQLESSNKELHQVKERNEILEPDHLAVDSSKKTAEQACKRADILEKSNVVLRITIEEMKETMKGLTEERDKCKQENGTIEAWKTKAEQSAETIKYLQEQLKQTTSSYRNLSQEKQDIEQKASNFEHANDILLKDVEDFTKKLQHEKEEKEKFRNETAQIKILLEKRDDEIRIAASRVGDLEKQFESHVAGVQDKIVTLENKLCTEEEQNVALKKTVASFIKVVGFNIAEAERNIQERDEVELSAIDASDIKEKIHKTEERLQSILEKKSKRKFKMETLGMAKDYIRSTLDYVTADNELLLHERDLCKLKTENLQSELDALQKEHKAALKSLEKKVFSPFCAFST